jgi:hypothetical protein
MSETIEITGNQENNNNAKWKPFVGTEVDKLIKYKGFTDSHDKINNAGEKIIDETYQILEMCGNPNDQSIAETGLVLGYVQSGKTLSFTSLTAMARDNNFQIVIIIAGTSTSLSEQSYKRMLKDLQIDERRDRKWKILKNPENPNHRSSIQDSLEKWQDATLSREKCSTVLITVMKQTHRLQNLINVMRSLDLANVPTLIIDDESDQASLNTRARANAKAGDSVNEGDASTIYRRINNLREVFPHNTLLQYTATPQANLFINMWDRLSPNFIKLLTPGAGYTGGSTFFINNDNLVQQIPNNQIPTNQNQVVQIPESLLSALRIFFLGVVVGEINDDQFNRTMLIHPSRLTADHNDYFNWINDVIGSWTRLLESSDTEEKERIFQEFKISYNDLSLTVDNLPDFEGLREGNKLLHAIKYTRSMLVNASRGKTPQIPWRESYSWILVGGQAMDRGFTVEGLTVTYMPRSLATGQIDTTLQRARFFGYKGGYIGFCRVWLDSSNISAYIAIIEHEEDVRRRLLDYAKNNKHLNNWERQVVKNRMLRLTRPNIIFDGLDRDYFGSEWFSIRTPHDTDRLILENREIISEFISRNLHDFNQDSGHQERTFTQKHLQSELSISEVLEYLLSRLKFTKESDSQTFSSLQGVLASYSTDNPDEECLVYIMSSEKVGDEVLQSVRKRQLKSNDEVQQYFQGPNPAKKGVKRGEIYPGDRNIKNTEKLTIQIHRLQLVDEDGNNILDENKKSIYEDVPSVTVWIPESIGKDIIRQPENTL